MILKNIGILQHHNVVSHPRRLQLENNLTLTHCQLFEIYYNIRLI